MKPQACKAVVAVEDKTIHLPGGASPEMGGVCQMIIDHRFKETHSMSGQLSGLSKSPPSMTKRSTCSLDMPW